jgi:hypothetical protein
VIERRAALLLPLQGLIATAMLFSWYADYIGATAAGVWPGWPPLALILLFVVVGHRVAAWGARHLGRALDARYATVGLERLVLNAVELVAQAPVMLLYGYALGRQVAI